MAKLSLWKIKYDSAEILGEYVLGEEVYFKNFHKYDD